MKLFKRENNLARKKIIALTRAIVPEISRYFDSVISIMLVGSFARNEGVCKMKNGKVKILSDLDLLVITKRRERLSEGFVKFITEKARDVGVVIELEYVPYTELGKRWNKTNAFDKKNGIILWGKNICTHFPKVLRGDINFDDISFLFFNRIFLTLKRLSFVDFKCLTKSSLEKLSYEACKTMFTCVDLFNIANNDYQTSFTNKMKSFNKQSTKIADAINKQAFSKDLNKAFSFMFEKSSLLYFRRPYEYWLRARNYLIKCFFYLLKEKMVGKNLLDYLTVNYKLTFKSRMVLCRRLLKSKRIPRITWKLHPALHCKNATLMLYLAIGTRNSLMEKYVDTAEKELSKIYIFKKDYGEVTNKWINMKDKLIELISLVRVHAPFYVQH